MVFMNEAKPCQINGSRHCLVCLYSSTSTLRSELPHPGTVVGWVFSLCFRHEPLDLGASPAHGYFASVGNISPLLPVIFRLFQVTGISWDDGCHFCGSSSCEENTYEYAGNLTADSGQDCYWSDSICPEVRASSGRIKGGFPNIGRLRPLKCIFLFIRCVLAFLRVIGCPFRYCILKSNEIVYITTY